MPRNDLSDLVVLALAVKRHTTVRQIVSVAKSLIPEFWSPTAEVIESAIDRNLTAGCLAPELLGRSDVQICLTPKGKQKFTELLLLAPSIQFPGRVSAWTTVQLCCLDLADGKTVAIALERLLARISDNIRAVRHRSEKCPHSGRFTRAWFEMEQHRLETMARVITEASTLNETPDPKTEPTLEGSK